jgi:hypothetical protein
MKIYNIWQHVLVRVRIQKVLYVCTNPVRSNPAPTPHTLFYWSTLNGIHCTPSEGKKRSNN